MLFGRAAEVAVVDRLVASSHGGRGGSLILLGEAGCGKTALLEHAREAAGESRKLHATGLEAECSLPFAALAEILRSVLDGVPELPPPQAAAVEGALALGPPAPGDRFAVCAGFLGLLEVAARDGPLLVTVDDVHWVDVASRECLAFAARRADKLPLAMLGTARGRDPGPFEAESIDLLEIGPLGSEDARSLVAEIAPDLAPAVVDAVVEAAAGLPLALRELPLTLTAGQRAGSEPLAGPLPPPADLAAAFSRRIEGLTDAGRQSVVVMAAASTPDPTAIVAACGRLGIEREALQEAEAAGIVSLGAGGVRFSHPLFRGAAYHGAPPPMLRGAHGALSEHTSGADRAWHLALAAPGPDEEAASALAEAAEQARERGAHVDASKAFERAAGLSTDPRDRDVRLIAAGDCAAAGGAHELAFALLERARRSPHPDLAGCAAADLAVVTLWETGNVGTARDLLLPEADRVAAGDPARAASLLAHAALAMSVGNDCPTALATAGRAAELLGEGADPTRRAQVHAVLAWARVLTGDTAGAREALAAADRLLPEIDPLAPEARAIALAINTRAALDEYERVRDECEGIVAGAKAAGYLGFVPFPQICAADAKRRLGAWAAAHRDAEDAIALAEEIGQRGSIAIGMVTRARLAACRGEEGPARAAGERALAIAEPAGLESVVTMLHSTLASMELYLGRPPEAIEALEAVCARADAQGYDTPNNAEWFADLTEAYMQAGEREKAAATVAALDRRAGRWGGANARALAARARGLVVEDFDASFARALELHAERPEPYEEARTLLAFGTRLHRARRRAEARDRLRAAEEIFARLGARPWLDRTRAELRAAGATRRAAAADPDELTAQEVRVALAVARGATNREVASELFLSPKTIEFHLGRVYRKLDIHSRTELAKLVADGGLGSGPAD